MYNVIGGGGGGEHTQVVESMPALQASQNHGMVVNEERLDLSSSVPCSSGTP